MDQRPDLGYRFQLVACITLDLFSPGSPCIRLAQSGQASGSGTLVPACDKRHTGQSITWNGQAFRNNSLVTLSLVKQRVNSTKTDLYPLVCQGITGGQWYDPSGVLFLLATPDPVSTTGGLGQRNVSGGVELYRGTPSVFPHGVQCCTNTTITLCVGMYSDLTLATSVNLTTSNGYNYGLSVAATYGPNIIGGVQFQLLTPTNVDPPVFQLTCTSTSSPPTDVLWTTNGSPVSNTSSQIVTNRTTSTYNNILTVTGRAYGMYTCTVTTTCSPVCGEFTLNPRSTTSFLTVQAPPDPPTGVTAVQSGPTSVSVSWTVPTSGGPVTRYDIYYVANGGPSTSGDSTNSTSYVLTKLQVGVQYNISVIAVGTSLPSLSAPSSVVVVSGQEITWNGQVVKNNSLMSLSSVQPRVSAIPYPGRQYPLVCQGITGGQWYEPSGVLFPLATTDPVSTPGGLSQRNVSGGVELYCETSDVFPHGVQCCTNTTITLCVGMYTDLTLAASVNLTTSNGYNYGLSVAATYGPNIIGGVQFQLLTPTNVDPPMFQLTCTSTSSPPTDVLWTTNGSPVSNTSSQIVTNRTTSTYNNTLTVTGRAYGMYTCTVTTTCSPVCGGFTLNPRSTTSSLTVQTPPGPPTGVTAVQSGPTSVSVSWTAPTSGGPVTRYDIYYVANGGPSTSGDSTNSTSYVLTKLQVGVQYNISVIAVGISLPSLSASSSVVVVPGQEITWNGQVVRNNSLVSVSSVQLRVSATPTPGLQYPLVCQGITSGQWYEPSGVLFPLATPDPGGLGQRNVPGGVELYLGTSSVFPHGVQCCTNTTITLCVGMYSDLTLATSVNLATSNGYNYGLSVAATYGPNITGGLQFQLLTPTNVDPPVFQLTCTSTSSPPTDVLWTTNGSPVSNTSSQIVTDRPTSTYNNTLTVTGRAYGMYTCTVTTTCSPVCGEFTLNPRSTTSSLTVQASPDPPTGVTGVQSGPTSVSVSWTAPTSGGPVVRYDIYYVANGGPSTSGGSTNLTSYVLTKLQVGVQYNISVIAVGTSLPSLSASSSVVVQGQKITWNGQVVKNNSLVSLSSVQPRVSAIPYPGRQYPLVCQGITGGQWYEPSGVLFPLATPDPVSTPGGLGQRNGPGGVELYRGTPSVFPHGIQCCTYTTITLCVGMYSDLKLAASVSLATSNGYSNGLSVAATYGPNITGGVQFQLLTPTNVDPPVFQLTCTSTSSPPTDVLWTTNGSPVSNTSSQIVTDRPTSTYNNTLTVTGRAYGMYTCTVTTTCSPVCGGFTLNPRSSTSSFTVEAPPGPPTGVTAVQSGPTSVSVSWTAPTSGGPVTRYDIYYVAFGGPSTSGVGHVVGLQAFNKTFTTITLTWQPPPAPNGVIIMYQVTYSTNGVVNTYNTTTPPVTVTGLVPRTTYTFCVTVYTITGPGTPQQVQTSTADIPHVTGVVVSAMNTTSVRVSWLAVQLPPDGILTGYTVYYLSLPNTSKRQSGGYTNQTFPPTSTSGDINNLNSNGVNQFSVVAQVTIMGQLYSGEMDTSLVNTPTITPGKVLLTAILQSNDIHVTLKVPQTWYPLHTGEQCLLDHL
ncbi:hypothetical protein EMCRGX_G019016 [Ephydatia muelleri]